MIRKLRARFIALAMLSLLVVLVVLMGSVNLLNYRGVVQDADEVLSLLSENGGSFPGMGQGGPGISLQGQAQGDIPYRPCNG